MKRISKELELEIADYLFNSDVDNFTGALQVLINDPWRALEMYEPIATPDLLDRPIAWEDEGKRTRAPEGLYYDSFTGLNIVVNKFGRVMNEDELYGEDGEEEYPD